VGGLGCLALGLLAWWVRGVAWGIALLAAAFLVRVQVDPESAAAWTPVTAAGLLLVAELAYWSFELDGANTAGARRLRRRGLEIAATAAGAGVLCELVLDGSQLVPLAGPAVLAVGVTAVAVLLGIVVQLARR